MSKSHTGKLERPSAQALHVSCAYLVGHHWHLSPAHTPLHTQSQVPVLGLKVFVPRPLHFVTLQTLGVGDGVGARVRIGGRVYGGNVSRGGFVKSGGIVKLGFV